MKQRLHTKWGLLMGMGGGAQIQQGKNKKNLSINYGDHYTLYSIVLYSHAPVLHLWHTLSLRGFIGRKENDKTGFIFGNGCSN